MPAALRHSLFTLTTAFALMVAALAPPAQAADEAKLREYLEVTGFDVALESIRLSADNAPAMLGIEADAFGSEWSRLVNEVFATDIMHEMALTILGETLTDDLLDHAADFYATDLGQRLVAVENDSHMEEEDGLKTESGEAIMQGLQRIDSPRIDLLERLTTATDADGASLKAIQEVQVRFLMAAAAAGVIELQMEEADLREAMRAQEDEMRSAIAASALTNAAYTYQAFSDEEVEAYAEALEHPKMQKVYALMNAVQYEIMANRFEAVAARLSDMQPSTDL
ncbi:hypothetical protein BOO69_08710 [Sulfitobacter alexandrii]|uniref:DUF2059 domain-containing protein n=1 Tax=Sulfitobacter alexandrii TaxID=1917485 RepID=A0A1J0WGM5_9RHOB|nr:DUF2059 domain-containing protein [Sulfitobacter alexandrii]APE43484.1 hypothetical protein BOO69_08710 [Sulfitobacter alexandrii]